MMESDGSEFIKQMTGSGTGNLLTAVLFGIAWLIRNRCCKHSKCKGHSICCDIELNNDDSCTEGETEVYEKEELVRDEVTIKVQKMHREEHSSLSGGD